MAWRSIEVYGVKADPAKTEAIIRMPVPQNLTEAPWFISIVNQLSKFIPFVQIYYILSQPYSARKNVWILGSSQVEAFNTLRDKLSILTTLSLYNPAAYIKLSANASSYGLGAVLLQETSNKWQLVAYASCTMSDSERHYVQIEKEALALMWAAEKFSM